MDFKKVVKLFRKNVEDTEKELESEVEDAEKWMKERRKFFIKLFWVILLVASLLIISKFL